MDKKIIIFLSIFFIIVFFANSVLAFNWNDGSLVSYYKLDETSGNTVYDATGNNNGIIVGSGYVLGQTGIITNDTAYNFLGTNSYVSITTIPIVNFGSGNFTITSWVKTNTSSVVNQQFIGQSSTNLLTPYFGFTLRSYNFQNSNNPSGAIDFHINTMYTDADIISMVPINDDSWHFLVGEKINNATGNFTVLYLDGNLIGATIINGITGPAIESYNNNIFAIGGNAGSSTGPIFFYGTIDEVGIWNRSLSSSEIQQLYNSGKGLNPNILPPRILISSISPSDNYYSSSLNMTTLGLITSYNNSIKNVTLILDGGENQVNSSGFNNTFYSFFVNGLLNGSHYWSYLVCDVSNYCSFSATRTIIVDQIPPYINISSIIPVDNYISTNGTIPVFSVNTNDNISGISNVTAIGNWFFNNSNQIPLVFRNPLYTSYPYYPYSIPNGVYSWYISVCDNAGNCNTSQNRTLIISIPTSSNSGSSGSGGGGGGGNPVTASQSSGNAGGSSTIQANQPIIINVSNSSTSLTQVQIISSQNSSNASVTVTPTTTAPTSSGQTYQSFQITLGGIPESNVINVSISFKINKTWIEANNGDPANVTLFRNTGTDSSPIWTNLSTTLTSQDSDNYYYVAISPGFSTYSVVVGNVSCSSGQSRCLVNDLQQCSSNQNWTTIKTCPNGCSDNQCIGGSNLPIGNSIYYYSIAFVIVVIGAVSFIILRSRRNKK